MTPHHAVNAYAQVSLETAVATASPHKLVLMLYDGAIDAIRSARMYLQQQHLGGKASRISKALAIIDELDATLNHEAGGEIAANLAALYDYMTHRLVMANLDNKIENLEEVERILSNLREGWAGIQPGQVSDPK